MNNVNKLIALGLVVFSLGNSSFAQTVWSENFENKSVGSRIFNVNQTKVLGSGGVGGGKCLEVEYDLRSNNGSTRLLHKHSIPNAKEYSLNYDIYFTSDWNRTTGGKFHGFTPDNATSGCKPNEADGWSCRAVFANRSPYLYTYHQDKNSQCGDKNGSGSQLQKGKWYSVSLHMKVNSRDNVNDGFARLYIDGDLVAEQNNREFRSTINGRTEITKFYFSTFLGGSPTGSVTQRMHARFDNFAIIAGRNIRQNPGGGNNTNKAPSVSFLSPSNNASFIEGENWGVEADASDDDGSIDNVQLFVDNQLIRQESRIPYSWGTLTSDQFHDELSHLGIGNHTLKIIATDNDGAKKEATRQIVITANTDGNMGCPQAPQNNWLDSYSANGHCWVESQFDHGIDKETVVINGQGYLIQDIADELTKHPDYRTRNANDPIYNDVQCGNGPANDAGDEDCCPGRVDLGKAGCNSLGPAWDMNWLSSRTRFGAIQEVNQTPTASFTRPLDGETFEEGSTLVVNVAASDPDGSIDNVELYLNNQLVRQEVKFPYDWNHNGQDVVLQNMAPGTYSLKTVATDDDGATDTKTITVTIEQEIVLGTQIRNSATFEINEYPNPLEGDFLVLEIDPGAGDIKEVVVTSRSGESLFRSSRVQSGGQLDLSQVASGIHVLRVVTEKGVTNKRLLKL